MSNFDEDKKAFIEFLTKLDEASKANTQNQWDSFAVLQSQQMQAYMNQGFTRKEALQMTIEITKTILEKSLR